MTTVEELRAKRVLRVGYLPAVHLALPVKDGGLLSVWGTTRFVAPAFITLQRSKSGLVPVDIAALHPRKPMMICQCDHLWQMKGLERNGPQETPGLAMINVVVSLVLLRAKTELIKWNAHCVICKSAKT